MGEERVMVTLDHIALPNDAIKPAFLISKVDICLC